MRFVIVLIVQRMKYAVTPHIFVMNLPTQSRIYTELRHAAAKTDWSMRNWAHGTDSEELSERILSLWLPLLKAGERPNSRAHLLDIHATLWPKVKLGEAHVRCRGASPAIEPAPEWPPIRYCTSSRTWNNGVCVSQYLLCTVHSMVRKENSAVSIKSFEFTSSIWPCSGRIGNLNEQQHNYWPQIALPNIKNGRKRHIRSSSRIGSPFIATGASWDDHNHR